MQIVEQWSGHLFERRAEKPRLECGRRHRRCRSKAGGGSCACGLHGRKYYRVPIVYVISYWLDCGEEFFAWTRARITSTARKWGRKRAWRMLEKFDDRIGRMEYH